MSRRERQRRRRGHAHGAARILFLGLGVLTATAAIGLLALAGWVIGVAGSGPSIEELKPIDPGSSSIVYAADGTRLGVIQSDVLRTPIGADRIPQIMKDATVAIEDRRFYRHGGVDIEGIVRSGLENVTTGRTVQGGSTLAMQLVRNLYTGARARAGIAGYKRKIREAKLAQELEGIRSKRWILTQYLNTIPYGTVGGQEAIGVQAAARVFFDKPASRLRLPEAALLAGLPQAPSLYNPFLDAAAARRRRNDVLQAMASQGMITAGQARRAMRRPLGVQRSSYYTSRRESFFFDFVRSQLIERYGAAEVRRGGLRITTTLDLGLQREARSAMANVLDQPGDPSSAIVTIDPSNGDIRAMASSASYDRATFNLAAQGRRQPGSAFKVMVLMTALRRGVNPATTTYVSKPLRFTDPRWGPIDVQTYSNTYLGSVSIVRATLASDNTVYQQLDLDLGPDQVKQTARDMGITSPLDGYPAEGLGGLRVGVSPLEMANAYATIADGGVRNRPIAITKVAFPDGRVDDLGRPRRTKEFSDGVTSEATKILQQNIQSGTGTAAAIGCPAAGKTGTTDGFRDAWFVGFTPRLATAVWVGYPNRQVSMTSVHGIAVAGGTFPAQIWGQYMRQARRGFCGAFPAPRQAFVSQPFFGRYATTGVPSEDGSGTTGPAGAPGDATGGAAPGFPTTTQRGGGTAPGQGGTRGYDPNAYESPPQQAPATLPAPKAPGAPSPAAPPGPGGAAPP